MRRPAVVIAVLSAVVLVATPAHAVTLTGNSGTNIIFGGPRDDLLRGAGGSDILFGKGGNDRLLSGSGNGGLLPGGGVDEARGGSATDQLMSDDGVAGDRLFGLGGDDLALTADGARDVVDCGAGSDTLIADEVDVRTGCEITVSGNVNNFLLLGSSPRTVRFGSRNGNAISTGGTNDMVFGLAGNDLIKLGASPDIDYAQGGPGADTIYGEDGFDQLIDDDGTPGDRLLGGSGTDTIISADGARDRIDCGAGDGFADQVDADPEDVIVNCAAGEDTVTVGTNRIR